MRVVNLTFIAKNHTFIKLIHHSSLIRERKREKKKGFFVQTIGSTHNTVLRNLKHKQPAQKLQKTEGCCCLNKVLARQVHIKLDLLLVATGLDQHGCGGYQHHGANNDTHQGQNRDSAARATGRHAGIGAADALCSQAALVVIRCADRSSRRARG